MSSSALNQIANALQNGVGIDVNLTGYTWERPAFIGQAVPNSSIYTSLNANTATVSTLTATVGIQNTPFGNVTSNIASFTSAGISTLTATNGFFTTLATSSFTANSISTGSLTVATIAPSSITANSISTGSLTVATIAPSSITANSISTGSLTVATIAPSSITANSISTGSLTVATIAPSSITANSISTGSLTVATISPSSIFANTISSGTFTGAVINTSTINVNSISTGTETIGLINSSTINVNTISTQRINASTINVNSISTGQIGTSSITITGSLSNTGTTYVAPIVEQMMLRSTLAGTTTFSWLSGAIRYVSSMTANISASILDLPTTIPNCSLVFTLIINQGATPYYASTLICNGTFTNIRWPNGTTPTPTANRTEVESFTLFYVGNTWSALGQYTSFA